MTCKHDLHVDLVVGTVGTALPGLSPGLYVIPTRIEQEQRPRFNIKMLFYQYRKCHSGDKTVVKSSYLHCAISYTVKMTSLYLLATLGLVK